MVSISPTPAMWKEELYNDGLQLQHVNPDTPEYIELATIAIAQNSAAIQFVPFFKQASDMCMLAVDKNGMMLEYVSPHLWSMALVNAAVENDGRALSVVTRGESENKSEFIYMTPELCNKAITTNWRAIMYIPKEYQTHNICMNAVQQYGNALEFINPSLQTPEIVKVAIKNGCALEHIRDDLKWMRG